MVRDASSKKQTAGKFSKGSQSKSVTPAVRRQRHGLALQDLGGSSRDSRDSTGLQDLLATPPVLPALSALVASSPLEDQDQELAISPSTQIIDFLSQPSIPVVSDQTRDSQTTLACPVAPIILPLSIPLNVQQLKDKPACPLFSTFSGIAKGASMETEKEKLKEKAQAREASLTKEILPGSKSPPITTSNLISEDSCHITPDSISSIENNLPQTLCSSPHIHAPAHTMDGVTVVSSMKGVMGQILEELRATKLPQEEVRKGTKDQLSQLYSHLIHLSTQVSQAKQRVFDLEDGKRQQESVISQIQSDLEKLQFKLDEMDNTFRRSNLMFIGVPEEIESSSSVPKVVTDLIHKCILSEKSMIS
ncbi:hypothetical protein NDU88_005066 [Pleurodeles waltl]|uniref:Uncharacterized protein n=1 Tax=Pleurodeles waltl TaxID=8319 RepID=A0AAV7MVA1_PLEWA|nr:hypothetical protein NDU88_005066 [Pleurodeles waltl]